MKADSNAAGVSTRTGSGTDQCSRPAAGPSSSYALSQTATTRSSGRSTSVTSAVRESSRSPCLRATDTARRCTRCAGRVPAEATGTGLRCAQSADASCDRAELCVQTNTTRGAAIAAACVLGNAPGTSRTYVRRRSASDRDRSTNPTCSSSRR